MGDLLNDTYGLGRDFVKLIQIWYQRVHKADSAIADSLTFRKNTFWTDLRHCDLATLLPSDEARQAGELTENIM